MAQPSPTQAPEASRQLLIEAYRKMQAGVLLFFVSWLILLVATFAGIGAMFAAMGFAGLEGPEMVPGAMLATMASIGIIAVIAIIIQLIGLFAKFIPGTRDLAGADPTFSTPSKLIRIGYTGGLIIALIAILIFIAAAAARSPGAALGALGILIIGIILGLIGYIGVIVLVFKLHGKEGETLYLVAGILMILFFVPYIGGILQIIAWILFYIALGHSIEKLSAPAPPPSAGAQPV